MSTITFDFRHYYRKGERRESDQIAYQWDLGHVAEIYVPVNATYEIHYCFADFTETDDYGVESIAAAEDGGYKLTAHIPNELFERSGELKVYVIGADDNHVLTTYEGYITIRGRAKPEDYVDDDPENEATRILTEAREARDAAIEAAEQAEAAASQSAAQASIAEVYDATKTYAIGDYCLHDGQLYECTTEITTPEAWTAAHWTAATVGTELNDIKGDVTGLKEDKADKAIASYIPYIDQTMESEAEKTGTVFIVKEKDPRCFENVAGTQGTIHGVNRLDIANASFSMSGYSSHYTITKQNNGIKIETDLASTTSSHYAYAEYTAEFEGTLYLSCDAKLISGKINTLVMMLLVNGTEVGKAYGEGMLYVAADVVPNDVVRICFYGHLNEDVASTTAYENIMLSYGGLYPFVPYKTDVPTGVVENVYTEKALSDYMDGAIYHSTPKHVSVPDFMSDAIGLPSDINTPISNMTVICDEQIPITAYNTLYHDSTMTGIAVDTTGRLYIRVAGLNKTGLTNWLVTHPLTVKYKIGETTEGGDISPDVFQQGIILTYSSVNTIKYNFTKRNNNGTIVCFGDSITGMFTGKCAYTDMIDIMSGYHAINCGFSGTGYCDHNNANYLPFSANRLIQALVENDYSLQDASPLVDPNASAYDPLYAEHLQNLKTIDFGNVDYVSFFYGTNDWGANKILFSVDDPSTENKQRTNVQDAVIYCIGQLLTKYPHLRVIVATPYWRAASAGKDSNVDPNSSGVYLYEFADKIAEFASTNFNAPILNLYRSFGANVITNRYFTKDGTHPTERGKRIIAARIIDCMDKY